MRRTAFALVALATAVAGPALAGPRLSVALDHSERLSISRPAGSVIVGNPLVADVTVVDQRTLYISGRGYGVTEVVVLDPLGRPVWQGDVVVSAPEGGQVSVYRGSKATEMACAGVCAPSIRSDKDAAPSAGAPVTP
jgi:Flp pilus assembly secretin CpaC